MQNMMYFTSVISGEHIIHPPRLIFVKHIIHIIILRLTYHENIFDSEWSHGKFQGEEVCDGQTPVDI